MFGFVKSDKNVKTLGGEIFKQKKKHKNIIFILFGAVAFVLLNFVLYSLTKM